MNETGTALPPELRRLDEMTCEGKRRPHFWLCGIDWSSGLLGSIRCSLCGKTEAIGPYILRLENERIERQELRHE